MEKEEKFKQLTSQIGEHFEDYLLIVRCPEGMAWHSSDSSWALGSANRFISEVQDRDRINLIKILREEE